ncbi:MAG: hypothetical protein GWO86_02855, partial [Planctomycetes bacterium]|nr:hypothetical protein [Planctomycetota bacterium]
MTKKRIRILIEVLIAAGVIAVVLYLYRNSLSRSQTVDSGHRQVMGTFARVVVIAADEKTGLECVRAAFEKIQLVDELMSTYKPTSQISKVNAKAFDEPVVVDELVFDLLEKSVVYSKKTGGVFDITVAPLSDLWKEAEDANLLPSDEALAAAKAKVGFDKLRLDTEHRSVKFTVRGMKLDLGAIAKGYSIDLAVEAAKKHGALGVMVDIGGDIRCFGQTPRGKKYWVIGLQNPVVVGDNGQNIIDRLKIFNMSVTTSGNYRRFVTIGGIRHSHIINPATAASADELSSVTVIAPKAVDADALATAVSVLGLARGLELIENTPNTEAILIPNRAQAETITTSGAEEYL